MEFINRIKPKADISLMWTQICLLREEEGILNQIKFNITGKEPPVEILEVECIMADFFEAGITNMTREGEVLKVHAGTKEMVFAVDKSL